jgi:hypothetical protein
MIKKTGEKDGLKVFEIACDNCSTGTAEYEAEDWGALA